MFDILPCRRNSQRRFIFGHPCFCVSFFLSKITEQEAQLLMLMMMCREAMHCSTLLEILLSLNGI